MFIYYDNITSSTADGGIATIDRVYCLSFSAFTDGDWASLSKTYESLPGWLGHLEHGCPCWFGSPESSSFLAASVEPSGLQVFGQLPPEAWQQWHVSFVAAVSALPTFEA